MSNSIKALICVGLISLLSACASMSPLEQAGLERNVIYKISYRALNTSIYLRFLPGTDEGDALLFKTANNSELIRSLEIGAPGVYLQKSYIVSERGKVGFRFIEQGLYENLLRDHQYSNYGSQQDDVVIFKYRLDLRKATKVQ